MAQFEPISYGPPVQADLQGTETALRATAQRGGVFQQARELGGAIEGGSRVIAQGLLHNQVLRATAATKDVQAKMLDFIDRNRVVTKAQLAEMMSPDDYAAWADKNSNSEYADKEVVPMYMVAGDLYDSTMKQAHEKNGQTIALPGWRDNWNATAETEASTIRERYVNRIAADQMVADNRATAHDLFIRRLDSARTQEDIAEAKVGVTSGPWFSPGERGMLGRMADARADTLTADTALSANGGLGDVPTMKKELERLSGPDAAKNYPHITEQQRLTLQQKLEHQVKTANVQEDTDAGITWARDATTLQQLPNSMSVDRAAVLEQFKSLKGSPTKIKAAETEMNRLMQEGDTAQRTIEGRAFIRGVAEIEQTGHMSAQTRAVLSNPNGTEAAGHLHAQLISQERSHDKNDPILKLSQQQAFVAARGALQRMRLTGMTFNEFVAMPINKEGVTIGGAVGGNNLKPLQSVFLAAQQTEKKNDEHPLSSELAREIRLTMKDAYRIDPNKTLGPEELTIHANIETYLLSKRNAAQDTGGVVKPVDYAQWLKEAVHREEPDRDTVFSFSGLTQKVFGKRPLSKAEMKTKVIDGEMRFWNGEEWIP